MAYKDYFHTDFTVGQRHRASTDEHEDEVCSSAWFLQGCSLLHPQPRWGRKKNK